jgi:2-C-methyl-D-erythritol 2,4-cyclodiphosphate synthase
VGVGYDIHRLIEGRKLVVGGIEIPHRSGLVGHSDADVVLHAVADALLGAAGLPDIGDTFPDTDQSLKDANSLELLSSVAKRVFENGLSVQNIDVIVHAEAPKMSPYKRPMAEAIAVAVGCPPDLVSVKAKTNEGVGPVGHTDAIASTAVALLAGK